MKSVTITKCYVYPCQTRGCKLEARFRITYKDKNIYRCWTHALQTIEEKLT